MLDFNSEKNMLKNGYIFLIAVILMLEQKYALVGKTKVSILSSVFCTIHSDEVLR